MTEKTAVASEMLYVQVSELRGSYPEITLPTDVDVEGLGPNPMFVTLPVMPRQARSGNGRKYGGAFGSALEREINDKRPEGGFGHLRDDERATRYDPPDIRWLRAQRDSNGTVWAKGIVLTQKARDHFRQAKATGARVATSIYGWASEQGGEAVDIDLEKLDIADPTRAGIREAVAPPHITSEMEDGDGAADPTPTDGTNNDGVTTVLVETPASETPVIQQESIVNEDFDKMIAEMRTERDNAQTALEQRNTLVAELQQLVPGSDLLASVKVLVSEIADLRKQVLTAEIAEVIAGEVKLADLRPIISEMLGPVASKEAAQVRVRELLQSEHIQRIAKSLVLELGGPRVVVTTQGLAAKFEDTPEKRAAARGNFGI